MCYRITSRILALLLLTITGCSYRYEVEVRGTIGNAITGKPVPRVKVQLNDSSGEPLTDFTTCNELGEFHFNFSTSGYGFTKAIVDKKNWSVTLSADGFEPETIDVGELKMPQQKETTHIVVRAFMRPSTAAAAN